ncbi:hypothetical protein SUGI_1071360 [Cryptomeria japonica]|uniref:uncharacterized protein LOC131073323 n=1 Tax=Cryptomeria japonica TaxID=3369 RepID=UPI00241484F4|nr:uncharacterized protein LOC131073323 [Cryptomeria japonica]GLJ50291.1 hypothetical protein SUGI_1071360 [Cryptomeria japonica]
MKKSLRNSLCRGADTVVNVTMNPNSFRSRLAASSFLLGRRKQGLKEAPAEDHSAATPSLISSYNPLSDDDDDDLSTPPTLEEMLARLQEEEEEEAGQLAELIALSNLSSINPNRMSSVNNSDLMRAAQRALNVQCPRLSVDGRDVNQGPRSDFARKLPPDIESRNYQRSTMNKENDLSQGFRKPCLVERLMGLEIMPVKKPTPAPCLKRSNTSQRNDYLDGQYLKDLCGATGIVPRAINDRRFMVKQPLNSEKQKYQRPLPPDGKQIRQGFGSYQKSAIKSPLGMVQVSAAGHHPSYSQTKKLQASSSKPQELLMKKQPNYRTNIMEEKKKKSDCRLCSNRAHLK